MKSFVALLAVVAVVAADVSHVVPGAEAVATILAQDSEVNPDNYQFKYDTSNGIAVKESGELRNAGTPDEAIVVQGSNQYTAPDGQVISTFYTADANGYHPEGAHLPTAPPPQPIPDYIQRSIEYNAAHAKPEVGQKYQ